jgi:hypothetical protein
MLSTALLLPAASPTAATYTPTYVDDASPWGSCATTYGFYNCDGMPDQVQLDQSNAVNGFNDANWYDLEGGSTSRPYVKNLSIKNGATVTDIVTDGTVTTLLSNTAGRIGVVLSPFNLCDADMSPPAPDSGECYDTPNRIGIALVYRKSTGSVGFNFTRPNDGQLPTPNEIDLQDNSGAPLVIDENTEIRLEINLNTIGKSLRWTWMNGIPSYWSTSELGTDAASFTVHAKLASMPRIDNVKNEYDTHLCTTVPISACAVPRSNSDWLQFQMVLSLDSTMSAAMTGALFATEGAIMGSVEVATDGATGLPVLRYAAASSHYLHTGETAGDLRYGKMHAVIPASALVQQLGVPSFADSSAMPDAATPSVLFTTVREGACGSGCSDGTTTFTEWTSGVQGTDGILVDIDGMTFSAPKFRLKPKSGAPKAPEASKSGNTQYEISVTSNGTCKKYGCTVKLFKAAASKVSGALTLVSTKSLAKNSAKLSFMVTKSGEVKRGTRYVVVMTRKDTGALVSSAPAILP